MSFDFSSTGSPGFCRFNNVIVSQEGIMAFYTGFGAYYLRTAPHAMLILILMEPVSRYYKKAFKIDEK